MFLCGKTKSLVLYCRIGSLKGKVLFSKAESPQTCSATSLYDDMIVL